MDVLYRNRIDISALTCQPSPAKCALHLGESKQHTRAMFPHRLRLLVGGRVVDVELNTETKCSVLGSEGFEKRGIRRSTAFERPDVRKLNTHTRTSAPLLRQVSTPCKDKESRAPGRGIRKVCNDVSVQVCTRCHTERHTTRRFTIPAACA